jgi:hypothetical protein
MTQLSAFSVSGVSRFIEDFAALLRDEKNENQRFQIEVRVGEITGQMRRLLRPIYRRDKGTESMPPMIPAHDMGIPKDRVRRVDDLISQSFGAYRAGDIQGAIDLAEKALAVWDEPRRR